MSNSLEAELLVENFEFNNVKLRDNLAIGTMVKL